MKTLSLLLPLTLLSLSASASDLPSLKLDLDGDGTPDLVRIAPLNQKFNRLEVQLSQTGQVFTLDSLVKTTVDQVPHQPDDGSYCSGETQLSLKRGEKNRTFVFTETFSDEGGCAGQLDRSFTVELGHFSLKVTSLLVHSYSWSMGDQSPVFDLRFDFANRTAKVRSYDVHDHDKDGKNNIYRHSAPLPQSCGPMNLADFEKAPFPECTKAVVKSWKFLDCSRNEGIPECPVVGPGPNG